jgi:hypothetical protein
MARQQTSMISAPTASPKRKRSVYWWLAGAIMLLLCLFFFQLFGPNPKIIISKQTTYITSPLRPDGVPNYSEYLVESARKGITADNNGAAPFWRAIGLGEIDAKDRDAFAAELGITEDLLQDHSLQPFSSPKTNARVAAWLQDQGRLTLSGQPVDDATINQVLKFDYHNYTGAGTQVEQLMDFVDNFVGQASESPWTSKEYPPFAEWVSENQEPLDLLVKASKRPRFYSPTPVVVDGNTGVLIAAMLPSIQAYREVGRSLPVRAMWHAGEGRPKEAWQDLLAVHRFANICAGNTLVEYLVADAISNIACNYTCTLVGNTKLSSKDARQILDDLMTLPRLPPMTNCIDRGERIFALGEVLDVASGGGGLSGLANSSNQPSPYVLLNHITVDWNIVLEQMNFWFDRMTAALQTADAAARTAAIAQVVTDMERTKSENWSSPKMAVSVVSRSQRSRLVATTMVDMLIPAVQATAAAENRANTMRDITQLAAALAVYRAEQAEYPEKLSDLVPTILAKLPVDYYRSNPYIYSRTTDGYLLYSTGENGADDGGSNAAGIVEGYSLEDLGKLTPPQTPRVPDDADDIAIRVPRLKPASTPPRPASVNPQEGEAPAEPRSPE